MRVGFAIFGRHEYGLIYNERSRVWDGVACWEFWAVMEI